MISRPGTDPILRFAVLACILVTTVLMVVATALYPGGSMLDVRSVGFDL